MPYKDPQEKAANDRAYYIANKERIRARSAEYRKSHLAEERKANAAWRNANRERSNEIKANWKKAHPDKVNAREKMLDAADAKPAPPPVQHSDKRLPVGGRLSIASGQ